MLGATTVTGMRFACALGLLAIVAGCGGRPVGEKLPKPDPTDVAVGAAAAAAAATLADPNSAGKKPEGPGISKDPRGVRVKETVPEGVLNRSETDSADEDLPPCEPADREGGDEKGQKNDGRRLELIPSPVNDVPHQDSTPAKRKKCRDPEEDDAAEE